ncbi:putative ribonuclease H-like domain-containing protein [Tanacetum coccineum]
MELENTQNNALAKLPMLKLGEYEMWEMRIKQYFFFRVRIMLMGGSSENGNSWVPIPVTTPSPSETGPSTAIKMIVPSIAEEKTCKKNNVKARSFLLMALPNEHQLTFDQYVDAQSMFVAFKARFGGGMNKKKHRRLCETIHYENFSALSSESLDSIFNRLQRLVSRLAILGVVTPPEDLNVKFLRSLPSEWDTHVVVWMNKPDFDTIGLDDLYNNFKIIKQKVKKTAGARNDDKNLAFLTTSGASSTNNINTVNPEVSTATTKVKTASTEISTATFSDATIYAFLSTQPQRSKLVHEDLEQLHDDDLEEMDLKWNMALLSMRARKFYQRTRRKIIIDGSNTAGYDKSKVECFNCHKMGRFARECRAPRSKDNRNWNQGTGFDGVTWQRKRNFRQTCILMAILESEVSDDEDDEESNPKVEKKTVISTATKKEFVKPEKQVKRSVSCPKHMAPRAVLMKTGLKPVNTARPVNTVRSVNTGRPFSTARSFNTVRPSYTAHPKSTIHCARPRTYFQNQAQSTVHRPFYKKTALTNRCLNKRFNTGRPVRSTVNTVREKGFNAVKPSACWVWRPIKPNGASLLPDEIDGGYVTFGGGAYGGRITGIEGLDETTKILKNFIKEVENLVDKKVKIIRSDNGTEFKNKVMDDFCREKGIKREYSVARTPQQNGVAERKNRTLIEAARTMLADSKLPTTFWAEAVSTACYVQNRVLIVKPHNKTPYELFRGFKPAIGFMKPFGCHVTILNTLDNLGKFDGKSDEGFFVGYSLSSKAFRVYNTRTRKVQENLHIGFLENKPMIEGNGPKWLFDLDSLTQSMNYVPVVARTFSNDFVEGKQWAQRSDKTGLQVASGKLIPQKAVVMQISELVNDE